MLSITMSWTITAYMLMSTWFVPAQTTFLCIRQHIQLPLGFIMSTSTSPDGQICSPACVSLRTEWLTMVLNPKSHYNPGLLLVLLWHSTCTDVYLDTYAHTHPSFTMTYLFYLLNISWMSPSVYHHYHGSGYLPLLFFLLWLIHWLLEWLPKNHHVSPTIFCLSVKHT